GDNIKIPYLNGGLFDRDDIDKKDVDFPYAYFFELMEFFGMYNFTIDENDPDDAEIGVDPEMLGHIFENLLEDNKDKGAFYTPKEIVQYMSQESIAQYLKTYTDESLHSAVDELVKKRRVDDALQDKETALKVHQLLCNVKVCDPAIGSGAFPMGILNVLYHSRLLLYGFTNPTQPFSPAAVKREIIQNNIYGVDIEKGAIDIARLRFWLSIVVDSEKPEPLPNFDYKFMQGDSLRESFGGFDLSRISSRLRGGQSKSMQLVMGLDSNLSKQNLLRLLREYFSVTNHTQKNSMRCAINEEVKTLLRNSFGGTTSSLEKLAQIDCSSNQDFFLWHTWFKDVFDKGGFDIVIANPPYLKEGRISKSLFEKYKDSPYYMGKMDLWYMFACKSLDLLNDKGVLCYIATNNWVTSFGARILRNKVIKETRICTLIDFGALMVFESASIQTMVMLFQKDNHSDDYQFDLRKIKSGKSSERDAIGVFSENSPIVEYLKPRIKRNSFFDSTFTFNQFDSIIELIQTNNKIYLTDSEIAQGIVFPQDTLNKKNTAILGNGFSEGQGIFVLSDNELKSLSLNKNESQLIKPYYTTSQINRYVTSSNNFLWAIYTDSSFKDEHSLDKYPNIKKHLDAFLPIFTSDNKPYGLHRARKEKFFINEKIIALRKCVDHPIFAYCDFECYLSQTFNMIQTTRLNQKYLTGLLNSKLIEFWLKNQGKMQGDNFQLDKEPLQQIPIAVPSKETQQLIANIVDYIIYIKSESKPISNLVSNLFISELFEKIIDCCVFEIYFPKHVVEKELNLIEYAKTIILPIADLSSDEEKTTKVWNVFSTIKKTDNEIRNRMELFSLRSPEILKTIIES
ncbi:MAG: N-6 DNA methylase, partial [Clostridiales bacterium]|nr:N-6 DNA methylase [Clostridiales bacterium]